MIGDLIRSLVSFSGVCWKLGVLLLLNGGFSSS